MRGQLSVFLILGLVILIIFFVILPFQSFKLSSVSQDTTAALQIQLHSCANDDARELVEVFGLEGGQLLKENTTLPIVSLYQYGKSTLPPIDIWQERIEQGFREVIKRCTLALVQQGVQIESLTPTINVTISNESLILTSTPTYVVKTQTTTQRGESLSIKVDVPLGLMYTQVKTILQELTSSPAIPLTTFAQSLFDIDLITQTNYHLYKIQDQTTSYVFMFGALYTNQSVSRESASIRILNPRETFDIPIGKPFSFTIRVNGTPQRFMANTDLFTITNKGIIEFIPKKAGLNLVDVGVIGNNGGMDSAQYLFIIH